MGLWLGESLRPYPSHSHLCEQQHRPDVYLSRGTEREVELQSKTEARTKFHFHCVLVILVCCFLRAGKEVIVCKVVQAHEGILIYSAVYNMRNSMSWGQFRFVKVKSIL